MAKQLVIRGTVTLSFLLSKLLGFLATILFAIVVLSWDIFFEGVIRIGIAIKEDFLEYVVPFYRDVKEYSEKEFVMDLIDRDLRK